MNAFITTAPIRLPTSHFAASPLRHLATPHHAGPTRHARRARRTRTPPVAAADTPGPPEAPEAPKSGGAPEASPLSAPKEPPFELRGFSLANVFLSFGAVITITSFSSYISSSGTASATSLGFVYGVPILLVGCALKYAELQPVSVSSTPEAALAREQRGTEVQKKIYRDITRHRYGDEAHLSAALASLGLVPRGEACPVLESGRESVVGGEYCLELVFMSGVTPYREWAGKIDKFERFFGPGVKADVEKVDAAKRLVALRLTSTA